MSGINYLQQVQANHMTGAVSVNESSYVHLAAGKKFDDEQEHQNGVHFKKAVEPELQQLHNDYELVNAAYDAAIADAKRSGDHAQADALRREQADLQEAYRMCVNQPPGMHHNGAEFADMWDDRLDTLSDKISIGMHSLDGNPDTIFNSTGQIKNTAGSPVSTVPAADAAESSSSNSTGATNATDTDGGWAPLPAGEIAQMTELITRDPDAFMEKLGAMDNEQRQAALTTIQQNLQHANQMFSMMSNFQKAIHDTQKAVINNFRV